MAKRRTRRDFLKTGAAMAAGAAVGVSAADGSPLQPVAKSTMPPSVFGANERLVVGFVGLGIQGLGAHVGNVVRYGREHNVVGAAVCDVYSKRRDAALDKLSLSAENGYADYRALLDRSDIDAVFIATVDHWHARVTIDAIQAGKHVYCEKPMTRYLGEAFDVEKAVGEAGLVYQLGSQYTSEGKWNKATELVRDGIIGRPVLAQDSYTRNNPDGEWNYALDPDLTEETCAWDLWLGPLAPRPFDPDLYFRWKKYYPSCAGIIGNLLSHRIAPILLAAGNVEYPTRVACLGSNEITPDRDIPDQTEIVAQFPNGLHLVLVGSTVNEQGLTPMVRGHEATIYLGNQSLEVRPERPFADFADRLTFDDLQPGPSVPHHMANFYDAIRAGVTPNAPVDLAVKTQTVISLAEMSDRLGEMMHFDAATRVVTTGSGRVVEPITYATDIK